MIVNENEYKRRATTTDINIVQRKRKTEDAKMDRTTAEKEWLRRISGGKSAVPQRKPTSDQTSDQSSSKPRPKPQPTAKKHGNGFGDIAGMEDLKQRVKEGFINVLQHRDLADAYGIRPPSMLFYGPAGCGKTFFAEKMAEEVGIHFIKVVPEIWPAPWCTVRRRRSARSSRMRRDTRRHCSSLTSLTPWCRVAQETNTTSTTTAR